MMEDGILLITTYFVSGIEIVGADSLEETLSCDDLFLEYFNVYLSLPVHI